MLNVKEIKCTSGAVVRIVFCISILQHAKVRQCVYDLRVSNSAYCPNSLKVKQYMIN